MSNPRGPDWDPTQAGYGYPPNTDPAYSGQYPGGPYPGQYRGPSSYGPGYGPGYGSPMTQPTEQIPPYWQTGPVPPQAPPPPQPPKPPRWPWFAAGALILMVSGLVLALVIVSSSSKEDTVVAPPQTTRSSAPPRPATPTTPSRTPSRTVPMPAPLPAPSSQVPSTAPQPPEAEAPTDSETPAPAPAGSETVVYNVAGEGRAINITYVDTGGIMQTEFNVALPWSKEVSLPAPAKNSASVAVLNVGRDVTCAVTVNGAQIQRRTGQGLTICTGMA